MNVLMKNCFDAVVLRPLDPHGQVHAFWSFPRLLEKYEYRCYGKVRHTVKISAPSSIYGGDLIIWLSKQFKSRPD
jgi:hypothetical protein